jgi:hypothetical protein
MRRIALGIASAAAATAACLATLVALRDTPVAEAAAVPRVEVPARQADVAAAPALVQEPPAATSARTLEAAARDAEAQEQALRDAILQIGEDDSVSLDARLARYQEAVEAARGGAPRSAVFENPSMLTEAFLRMEGVQRELAAQSPAARAEELARIRRELGFDEEQIARMHQIDERREARWQNGLAYMEERARVAATFDGDALDEELAHLRERHFEEEAPTIEREEQQGFFRFERPRVFGRN